MRVVNRFGIGDRALYNENIVEVRGIDGDRYWVKLVPGDYYLTTKSLEPLYFEEGCTYVNTQSEDVTFDCHYVGDIGATSSGRRYAAGIWILKGVPTNPTTVIGFSGWRKV